MQGKHYSRAEQPLAQGLENVAERWSILILRECFSGSTRFDQFQQRLGIAPNILTRRLQLLVEEGLLERRAYSEHPPRYDYLLTDMGREFRPVLLMLVAWGNKHFAPDGTRLLLTERQTGRPVEAVLVDKHSGQLIRPDIRLKRVLRPQAPGEQNNPISTFPQAVDLDKEQ